MSSTRGIELNWIGKESRPKREAHRLLEDCEKSYSDNSLGYQDNVLIHGDSLHALPQLEKFRGKIKCICIDLPYNTGRAFNHYEDGVQHSKWLSQMRDRLELHLDLLSADGSIWLFIDDNEAHYLKVLCDEIFDRKNFVTSIAWKTVCSVKSMSRQFSNDYNTILVYSKNPEWKANPLPRTEASDARYSNPDNDPNGAWVRNRTDSPKQREYLKYDVITPTGHVIHSPDNGWRWKQETMNKMIASGEIEFSADGKRFIRKIYLKNQNGITPSNIWSDIKQTGFNGQAKNEIKALFPEVQTADIFSTPKPELVIMRILQIASNPGDWVLDSFAGSGTLGAVAQKMGRRWIMIELGEQASEYIQPRLKKVCEGSDSGGVSGITGWQGGGGFYYLNCVPSSKNRAVYELLE